MYAWIVVMKPDSIPNASCSTFATGPMQFVVQEAFDTMLVRVPVVRVVVHAEDERHVRVGRGGRDDDLLRARFEMELGLLALREQAGRLEDDLHAEILPRQPRRDPARSGDGTRLPPHG